MPSNPVTDQCIAAAHAAIAGRDMPAREQALIDGAAKVVVRELPGIDRAVIGEVMIHITRLMDAIVAKIREMDPVLDWESTVDVALNVVTHTGARLYEAGA